MARTQNTAHIKQRVAEEVRREEEAKAAEEDRMQRVRSARTRSQKAQAIAQVLDKREADDEDGRESADDEERGENNEEGEADEDEGEAGEDEGDASKEGEAVASGEDLALDSGQDGAKPISAVTRAKKKRSISDVGDESEEEEEEVEVLVPAFEASQATWELFEADLKRYMDGTKQKLVISENINVNRRNNTLRSQVQYQGREDEDIPLVPTKFKLYQRKYICTHGWRERERGGGTRTVHKLRRAGCPFQFLAQLAQDSGGQWSIRLAREDYRHNHAISTDVYRSYPGIRQVPGNSPLMPGIELLVEAQAGNSRIYDYIRDNSTHRVTMDDVRNLVNRIRKSGMQLSDDEAVAEVVLNFNLKCSKNVSTVNENSRGQTGVISFTTAHMRAIVDTFPEVVQMDCTHKTNKYNYQLLSIVAMDQFGRGQPVQYSFLETTSDWHMSKAIDHFKRANEHWRLVRIVIVDKDMREVEVIKRKLPEANVFLCHFHVIKWLHDVVQKGKYGSYPKDVVAQLKHLVHNMTYARTIESYDLFKDEFKSLSCRDGSTRLWEYFVANWDSCAEMWVMAYRTELPHFNNHTNNRVESFFGTVKKTIKGHFTMLSSLETLLSWQRRIEEEYLTRVEMPGTLRNTEYSEEMNIVIGMTTRWVAEAIETQYKVASNLDISAGYSFKDMGDHVIISNGNHEHQLQKDTLQCDCEFSQTMKLPCRHAMVYKRSTGSAFIVPFSSIKPRWFGQTRCSTDQVTVLESPFKAKIFKPDANHSAGAMSEREKFRRAQQIFGRISNELAAFPDESFEEVMTQFDDWWHNLRNGKPVSVVSAVASSDDHGAIGSHETSTICSSTSRHTGEGDRSSDSEICGGGSTDSQVPPTQVAVSHTFQAGISCGVVVKLNGKAPVVGRPRLNREARRNAACGALKEYNRGMRLRGLLRDKDVCDIVVCLEEIMPNLAEVRSYLHTHQVRFHSKSCSFTWSVDPSFVADIIRFRLPEATVDEMLERLKNTKKTLNDGKPVREEIAIDGEGDVHADNVVVALDKAGTFEREQIEAMKWLWNLQKICDGGIRCCTWLLNEVQQQVECTEAVTLVENILKAKWPYADVPGLSTAKYCDLYRFRSGTWLSDASIQAFACYLQERFKNNSCVVVASVSESAAVDEATFSVETFVKIGEAIQTNDYVFIPVNFDQTHWVCVVVARVTKQIIVYDSLNTRKTMKVLKSIATELNSDVLDGRYKLTTERTPRQNDGNSCGIFVCLQFWRRVATKVHDDFSSAGITELRWKMLQSVFSMEIEEA